MARLWVGVLVLALLLPELALMGFFTAGAVLALPAEPPHRADVVVVLGGGDGARYAKGRELVVAGFSEYLLLIYSNPAERRDALENLKQINIVLDDSPKNTWQEAIATRKWMQKTGWKTVLVVSDPPHMMRMHYAWAAVFRGTDLSYTLVSSNPTWWTAWRWWGNPQSTQFVENEVLKLGYYVFKYRFGLW